MSIEANGSVIPNTFQRCIFKKAFALAGIRDAATAPPP